MMFSLFYPNMAIYGYAFMFDALFIRVKELLNDLTEAISGEIEEAVFGRKDKNRPIFVVYEEKLERMRRSARQKAIRIFAIILGTGFFLSVILKLSIPFLFSNGSHFLFVFLITMFFTGPAAITALYCYYSYVRPRKSVLWLRRFNKTDKKLFKIYYLLNNLTNTLVVGVTIQDNTFEKSVKEIEDRYTFYMYAIFGLAVSFLFLVLGLEISNSLILWIIGGVSITAVIAPYSLFETLFGFQNLNASNYHSRINRLFTDIEIGKGAVFRGLLVLRCTDDYWREAVVDALKKVHAVLIDITEINENLIWELKQATNYLPVESIVLLYRTDLGKEASIPMSLLQNIASIISFDKLSRMKQFIYPSRERLISDQYIVWARKLKPLVIEAICNNPKGNV